MSITFKEFAEINDDCTEDELIQLYDEYIEEQEQLRDDYQMRYRDYQRDSERYSDAEF